MASPRSAATLAALAARFRKRRDRKKHPLLSAALAARDPAKADSDSAEDLRLCRLSCDDIRQGLAASLFTVERVVIAHCARAQRVGRGEQVNGITEEVYDEAIVAARAQDAELAAAGDGAAARLAAMSSRPLFGCPVTVKDIFDQVGCQSTMGAACRVDHYPEATGAVEDAVVVREVRAAGAIPFARGNVPQLVMLPETTNRIFGRTLHPLDATRGVGGSSGGDAALIAAGVSSRAIGTDVGGSTRIPAAVCGVCGFKPTTGRVPMAGVAVPRFEDREGQQMVRPVAGSMGGSMAEIEALSAVMMTSRAQQSDSMLAPSMAWSAARVAAAESRARGAATDSADTPRPLRIGVLPTDNWFEACPSVQRVIREVAEGLKQKYPGVQLVELPADPKAFSVAGDAGGRAFSAGGRQLLQSQKQCSRGFWGDEAARLYVRLLGAEGNLYSFTRALEGEPLVEEYDFLMRTVNLPNILRPLITKVLLPAKGDQRLRSLFKITRSGGISARELWEGVADLETYKFEAAALFADLDAVVLPTVALPALHHGVGCELAQAFGYTFFANLLDSPAVSVPAGRVEAGETTYVSAHEDSLTQLAQSQLDGSEGLPVSVQIMGGVGMDEEVVAVAKMVESVIDATKLPRAELK